MPFSGMCSIKDIDVVARHQINSLQGAFFGVDVSHAIGNICLKLHEWRVDFAVWSSHKYLNAGPGNLGGLFVHELVSDVKPT